MIFSTGKGLWILFSLCGSLALMALINEELLGGGERIWPFAAAFLLAGLINLGLGLHARRQPPRLVVEIPTGRERITRPVHSLYFIRAEYWGGFFLLVGLVMLGRSKGA
jgi:hypothetical protein